MLILLIYVIEVFGIMAAYAAIIPKTSITTYIINMNIVPVAKYRL